MASTAAPQQQLIFDIETNGLLPTMDRIHCLVILDVTEPGDGILHVFRNDGVHDNIFEGIVLLENADVIIGHNICQFDIPGIELIYPDFAPKGRIQDTLVLSRVVCSDLGPRDSVLVKRNRLPGKLVKSHSLDAWGYRLGRNKGDYSIEMHKKGLDPWASWNQDMEDYCVNDVEVNKLVWEALTSDDFMPPPLSEDLEHNAHEICGMMGNNGFPFQEAEALKLVESLVKKLGELEEGVKKEFKFWYAPVKKKLIGPEFAPIATLKAKGIDTSRRTWSKPNEDWGEDDSRPMWADIVFPKRSMKSKKLGDRTVGCPYCPIKRVTFNPNSSAHVAHVLMTKFAWQADDFTPTGLAQMDADIIESVAEKIPQVKDISDIWFHYKLIGQILEGNKSWIHNYEESDGRIHPYFNCGGTVTGRGSHSAPNVGQVPAVMKEKDKDPVTGEKIGEEKTLYGRDGKYGYECRSFFYTPEQINGVPWAQVGVDLTGIESRLLAEKLLPFDNGVFMDLCTSGADIHEYMKERTGIATRSLTKTAFYAFMYGSGDWKLGHICDPTASTNEKFILGKRVKTSFMEGVPGLGEVVNAAKTEAAKDYINTLDGRRIRVRAEHSALNSILQSQMAILSKKWLCLTENNMLDRGYSHGWRGDFAMMAWIHDEIQTATRLDISQEYAEVCVAAAQEAGDFFQLTCPIDAEYKIGSNWAECH